MYHVEQKHFCRGIPHEVETLSLICLSARKIKFQNEFRTQVKVNLTDRCALTWRLDSELVNCLAGQFWVQDRIGHSIRARGKPDLLYPTHKKQRTTGDSSGKIIVPGNRYSQPWPRDAPFTLSLSFNSDKTYRPSHERKKKILRISPQRGKNKFPLTLLCKHFPLPKNWPVS